ncbi:ANR family transcriptional regulator [Pantoea sp. BAV 3049]|uniref:ANR family transcriptional regulator n=1 Tax=Pantoea sp. BAV 3049 TaxID=2654188 RepID=UPI00131E2829|nr:ANR family transcriptional regulator [Pantoea sp. BAV 3049]
MRLTFKNLAQQAADSEKKGFFSEAAQLWRQAGKRATGNNILWAEQRGDFCAGAARRTAIIAAMEARQARLRP